MKRSIYAVISLMMAMVVGFTACGDDDKGFSAEQIAYFEKNLEFIREKKVLKGDDGELLYKQVVLAATPPCIVFWVRKERKRNARRARLL